MAAGFTANVGFTGIVVALVARNSPVACVPVALLFAAMTTGGGLMQSQAGVPSELVGVTQGIIVILVAMSGLLLRVLHSWRVDQEETKPTVRAEQPLVAASPEAGV
jgi:simple sugar transport system permease protein